SMSITCRRRSRLQRAKKTSPIICPLRHRIRVEDEAKQYVEQWEETVEMRTNFTIRLVTPLRHLLAEYHDICERILDEHEIVAGLLAYSKRARKRRRPASL